MKKNIWKILLAISFIPLIVPIIFGIYATIHGFSFLSETVVYGLEAFYDAFIIWSYVYWPTYIIGLILFIISIIKIKKSS